MSSFCLLYFPLNLSIPSSFPPLPFLLPFLHLILLLFLPPPVSILFILYLFSSCLLVFFSFLTSPLLFFFTYPSASLLFPQVHVSTSGIKEVFIDRDNSVFSAPALCFCSHKKPGEHITETLADSVSNVKLCVVEVKYCLSSTCTKHVLSSLQYITLYYIHVVIVT